MGHDFTVTMERGDNFSEVRVPFEGDTTELVVRSGRELADLIERMFPDGVADHVIAAIIAARLEGQIDATEVDDPEIGLSIGGQADYSPLSEALIPALCALGIGLRFDDI